MNDNMQLLMILAKLETLKITLQEEPLTSIVQDIQDDMTELINENSIIDELNMSETLSKEDKEETEPLNVFNNILDTWVTASNVRLAKNPLLCEHKLFKELTELETPLTENTDKTEKIKQWMDKIVKDMGLTYEPYNDNILDSLTIKTESNYLKDLFKDYR